MIGDTIEDMDNRGRYRIPPARALIAFESAARNGSFSRAAKELGSFQSAVSRQVATLEQWVSMRLFERSPAGVTLTEAGSRLSEAIAAGLRVIHRGVAEVEELSSHEQVVIACSNDISQFLLLPRCNALSEVLGEDVRIRILTYYQEPENVPPEPVADVILTWQEAHAPPSHRVSMCKEAVRPVCSPAYAASHADILDRPVTEWGDLTFVEYLGPGDGWANWDDWFAAAGRPKRKPRYLGYDNYAYLLEAAAAGRGIALGWNCFIDRFLATGALVALGEDFVEFDNECFCALTEKGLGKPRARMCLEFFENLQPLATS